MREDKGAMGMQLSQSGMVVSLCFAIAMSLVMTTAAYAQSQQTKNVVTGAVVGTGVGLLVGGKKGASAGAIVGAIAGAAK